MGCDCLPSRQEGFHGQVCYDQDESEGEEKKANMRSRWMLCCRRQTRAATKTVFKVTNFYLIVSMYATASA